ncbi:MAG: LuxR family transcriptional regulator [Candidatus Thiodiazotropha sp.]
MNLEDAIEGMHQARHVDQLFHCYQAAVECFGYDRVLLALISDHPRLHLKAQHGVLSSYPDAWVSHYLSQGYDRIDPVRIEVCKRIAPFSWRQLQDTLTLSPRQKRLFREAGEVDLHHGLGVPLRGPDGATAGVGLASSSRKPAQDSLSLWQIHNLSMQFYAAFWRLFEQSEPPREALSLSPREAEILKLLALGLTKADVSDRLRISYHTVDFHTRRLLEKFNTRSITAAVHFATAWGVIALETGF